MYGRSFPENVFIRGPNLQLKSLSITGCKGINEIDFHAIHLVGLCLRAFRWLTLCLIMCLRPQLQSVLLDFSNGNTMSRVYENISGVYQGISDLEFVTFYNLRQLSMHLYDTTYINLTLLFSLICTCPALEEFHLDTENVEYMNDREVQRLEFEVIHTGLKKVEITGHTGTKSEIGFCSRKFTNNCNEKLFRRRHG